MTIRTRNIYDPSDKKPFKLSRSKVENFISCKKCFYIDRRLGVAKPPGYPFNINSAVDELLKKEFDLYRKKGEPHPYMLETNKNLIPFQSELLDEWRENFKGVRFHHIQTNFILSGAVDDLWFDIDTKEVIVVDYKSTAKNSKVTIDEDWQRSYKNQMEFYQWLLRKNNLNVSNTGYFVYCNGDKSREKFESTIHFDVSVIEYIGDSSWVDETLLDIKKVLNSNHIPRPEKSCEYCSYIEDINFVIAESSNDEKKGR